MEYHLKAPLTEEDVRKLNIGDTVYLSGEVFTGRSRIHRYIFDEEHILPQEAKRRQAMVHVGPIMVKGEEGWELVSFMPTSSLRFEKWGADSVEKWGLRIIVGKTTMGKDTAEMMKQKKCVHVSPRSVSPNLWIDSIEVQDVYLYDELGRIEAAWFFKVKDLGPFIVDMDANGRNYFDELDVHVAKQRNSVLQSMGVPEDFTPTKLY